MKSLIWDFDGTLGYRDGGAWTLALLETLDREAPGHDVTLEQLRPFTRDGFPWHRWEQPHPHLADAEAWWAAVQPILQRAYCGVGLDATRAAVLACQFRSVYLNSARWRAFDDTHPTLEALASAGWTHILLTNHVPELRAIVQYLGLTPYFTHIFNSAETGYEKPHPRAFEIVLDTVRNAGGNDALWMIGDNFIADVRGAEAAGIPAILVRQPHPAARHYCETLTGVVDIVGEGVNLA